MRPTFDSAWNVVDRAKEEQGLASPTQLVYMISFLMIFLLLGIRRWSYKAEEADERLGTKHVMPIMNIRARWLTVALDGLLALVCGLPGLNFFALGILFYNYSFCQIHLLSDSLDSKKKFRSFLTFLQLYIEALLWANLFLCCLMDVQAYHGHLKDIARTNDLQSVVKKKFKVISFDLFLSTCFMTSLLLWRILVVNIMQIKAHVKHHRQIAWNSLTPHGKLIWQHFAACQVPGFEIDISKEDSIQKERLPLRHDWNWGWHHGLLVSVSSLVMFGGILGLHFEQNHIDWSRAGQLNNHQEVLKPDTHIKMILFMFVSAFQSTFFWIMLTWGVLRVTSQFEERSNRFLILSAISKPYLPQNWSRTNLDALDHILKKAGCKAEDIGIHIETEEENDRVQRVKLVPVKLLPLQPDEGSQSVLEEFDLENNAADWWEFRRFLQIDCLDGAACVEFCGVAVAFLLFNYAAVGLTSWLADHQVRIFVVFAMILILSGVLIFIMFTILQTCVDANKLLDMDAEVLRTASRNVLKPNGESQKPVELHSELAISKHAMLLHSMERDASTASDKQQLFGVPVTANLRNGWIISLLLAFGSSAWKVLGNVLADRMDLLQKMAHLAKSLHLV